MTASNTIHATAGGLVVSNPGILGGTPVFSGTRMPVKTLQGMGWSGLSNGELLDPAERAGFVLFIVAASLDGKGPWPGKGLRPSWPLRARFSIREHVLVVEPACREAGMGSTSSQGS
jgi:hypothetical protein